MDCHKKTFSISNSRVLEMIDFAIHMVLLLFCYTFPSYPSWKAILLRYIKNIELNNFRKKLLVWESLCHWLFKICNWAGPWENVSFVICEQQWRRSACASTQSDQRLCCSLFRKYNISRFYSRNFKTLASFCGCAGWFVSDLIRNTRRHILSWRGSIICRMKISGAWCAFMHQSFVVPAPGIAGLLTFQFL